MEESKAAFDRFRFLDDSPVIEDKFGSHSRVADSIARKVEEGTPGMTIGLEGTWGSGKSSVIRMLEERWKDNDDIQVFTFDAWAHQADPLRRSFLEEMIGYLTSLKWLKAGEWKKELDKLARLYEKQDTISTPHIKALGVIFALLWLLYPLGQKLFDAGRNAPFYRNVGFWLLAVPFLIVAMLYASNWLWRGAMWCTRSVLSIFERKWTWRWLHSARPWCGRQAEAARRRNVLAAFLGKSSTSSSTETYRDPQPTSIEFSGVFTRIIKSALPAEQRRLLIVVDNLDRVSTEDALAIWATMKTFIESSRALQSEGLWLIVPYDPDGIDRLWRRDGEEDGMVLAFKEKTFQVRYRVAAPLASRWEEYLKACIKEAFPSQEENVQHAIYHVFRIQGLPAYKRGTPTPREMKLFVNRMVSLAQQHHPDVPLPEIALYSAVELSEPTLLKDLAESQLKNEQFFSDFLSPDWREYLAAIHFGVPRKDAAEVLYDLRLREILQNGDAGAMQELLAEAPAQQCCERHLRDRAVEMGLSEVLAASRAFGKFTPQSASPGLRRAIGRLADRLASIDADAWAIGGELTKITAVDVVRLLQFRPRTGNTITDRLCVRVPDVSKMEHVDAGLSEWAGGASVVVAELAKAKDFRGITIEMPEPAKYQALLDLLANDANGRKVIKFFQPTPQAKDDYRKHVISQIQGGAFREEDSHILTGMLQMSCWDHSEVASVVSQAVLKCLSRDGVNRDVLCRAVKFLLEQAAVTDANPAFVDTLKKYGVSPHLCTALQQHHGHPEAAALCVALLLLHNPQPNFPDGQPAVQGKQQYDTVIASSDQNVAQAIAELCINYGLGDEILDAIQTNSLEDKPFTRTLLTQLASRDTELRILTTETFMKHHDLLLAVLDKEGDGNAPNPYEELVGRLLRAHEDSLLCTLESGNMALGLMRPCYLAINADDLDTGRLEERLREYFRRNVQQDRWLKELSEGSWTLDVMLLLRQKPDGLSLDHRYANALIDHAIRMRDGNVKIGEDYLVDEWSSLLDCMATSEREPFRRRLVSDVIGDGGMLLTPLLPAYGEEILEAVAWLYEESNKRGKRDIESKLIRLAEHDDHNHRYWLLRLLAGRVDVSGMGKKNIECLRSRLEETLKAITSQDALGNDDEDKAKRQGDFPVTPAQASELAHALGIVPEAEEDSSQDEEESGQVED